MFKKFKGNLFGDPCAKTTTAGDIAQTMALAKSAAHPGKAAQ